MSGGAEQEDEDSIVQSARDKPMHERLAHKHWKVRLEAYKQVAEAGAYADSLKEPPIKEFGALCCLSNPCYSDSCSACTCLLIMSACMLSWCRVWNDVISLCCFPSYLARSSGREQSRVRHKRECT